MRKIAKFEKVSLSQFKDGRAQPDSEREKSLSFLYFFERKDCFDRKAL